MADIEDPAYVDKGGYVMNISDALLTLAQVAVGLIGFSSVLIALSGEPGNWSALDRYRITGMLGNSIFLLLLSMLPFVLTFLGVEDRAAWRSSDGVFAACLFTGMIINFRGYERLPDSHRLATRPALVGAIYVVGSLVLVATSAGALGLIAAPEGVFFLGLSFLVLLSVYLIVRFLYARPNR
jgi:hypothetical protein